MTTESKQRSEAIEEGLEFLGTEARRVFDAGAEGEEWQEGRDSIEGCDAWYEYCDDCDTYHQCWYVPEYRVTRGRITLVIHSVDTDGDWSVGDEFDVADDADMERYECAYGPDAWCRQYDEYVKHVAETGNDPCGEFIVAAETAEKQRWTVCVTPRRDAPGLLLAGVRRDDMQDWQLPSTAPQALLDYMGAKRIACRRPFVTEDVADLDALAKAIAPLELRRTYPLCAISECHDFDVDIEIRTPRASEEVAAERRERARSHLNKRAERSQR